jgi:hypothetical protein
LSLARLGAAFWRGLCAEALANVAVTADEDRHHFVVVGLVVGTECRPIKKPCKNRALES